MPARSAKAHGFAAVLCVTLLTAGCQSSQTTGPQSPIVRSSVETAPADLQLMCAAEAANVYSAPSDRILPLSSARSGPASFDVMLDVAGRRARCTIDESGTAITVVDA